MVGTTCRGFHFREFRWWSGAGCPKPKSPLQGNNLSDINDVLLTFIKDNPIRRPQPTAHSPRTRSAVGRSLPILSLRAIAVLRWLVLTLLLSTSCAGSARTITDGDTLRLNGVTYLLHGIDAPETKQVCADGWPAGNLATTRRQALVGGRTVVCEKRDQDRYGRTVAVCWTNGEDVGAILVREDLAWAFVRYSQDYVELEASAKYSYGVGRL